jgi:hypothetical protein
VEELVQVGQERAIFLLKFCFAAFLWGIQNCTLLIKRQKNKNKNKNKNCSLYIKDSGLHFGEVGS